METTRLNNSIEEQYRGLSDVLTDDYIELYADIKNDKLKLLFSTLHALLISSFKKMNDRLPTGSTFGYFLAEDSRTLIGIIDRIETLQRKLAKSAYAFDIEDYYKNTIDSCKKFLKNIRGSEIPPNFNKIDLYYTLPIFKPLLMVNIPSADSTLYPLSEIGFGSYAIVYRYHDVFYNRDFVLKRAKDSLDEKGLERFHREFLQMSNLNSPYVVEVYNYNSSKNEYIMESMSCTLKDHIEQNNEKMSVDERKYLVNQLFRAFNYLHSKNVLHRDISPNNILIRYYEDTLVLKIADFGLVKTADSTLTSLLTELKGCFNDPNLAVEGFVNYRMEHETYALSRLVYYIMTGETHIKRDSSALHQYIAKGMHRDRQSRFHSVNEMREMFRTII